MDVYGLTGGIGAGKSAVAELLEEYGIPVVSADELSRMVVAKGSDGLRQVVDAFGQQIMDANGELDRRVMAQIVFQNPTKRRQLESILHPLIRDRYETVLDALEKGGHVVTVYEVPLLFEKNLQGEMKAVILVTASERNRVARVRARDGMTESEVRARIAAQMDEDEKRKRADYVVHNDGSLDDLRREVEAMLSRFMKLPPPRSSAELMGGKPGPESSSPAPPLESGPLSPDDLNLTPGARPQPPRERPTVPPGDPTRPAGAPPRPARAPTRSMAPSPDPAAATPPPPAAAPAPPPAAGTAPRAPGVEAAPQRVSTPAKAPPPPPTGKSTMPPPSRSGGPAGKPGSPPPPPGGPARAKPAPPSATPTLPPPPRRQDGDDG